MQTGIRPAAAAIAMLDDFVKNPISALRFIPQSLRRTVSTPHSAGFARLELGLFTKSSPWMTFYEFINIPSSVFVQAVRQPAAR